MISSAQHSRGPSFLLAPRGPAIWPAPAQHNYKFYNGTCSIYVRVFGCFAAVEIWFDYLYIMMLCYDTRRYGFVAQ